MSSGEEQSGPTREKTAGKAKRDTKGRFRTGTAQGPGRKRGGHDLVTRVLEALAALDSKSDQRDYLVDLAESHAAVFGQLLGRCIPRDTHLTAHVELTYEKWLADLVAQAAADKE